MLLYYYLVIKYPNHDHLNITTMVVREDILIKLMSNPITKIIGEPSQGNINTLKQELAEKAAKIKVKKGRKFVFLVVVLLCHKYGTVKGNLVM